MFRIVPDTPQAIFCISANITLVKLNDFGIYVHSQNRFVILGRTDQS